MNEQIVFFRALMYSLVAVTIPVVMVMNKPGDTFGAVAAILITVFCGWRAWRCFKIYFADDDETKGEYQETAPVSNFFTTAATARGYAVRVAAFLLLTFGTLTWITYNDLVSLETGTAERVTVFAPVSFVYNIAGFWPAVLTLPISAIVLFLLVWFKFLRGRKAKSAVHDADSEIFND